MRRLIKKLFAISAEKPHHALFRSTALVALIPLMTLAILVSNGELAMSTALLTGSMVFVVAIIFVRPYVNNIAALTRYVWQLSRDEKVDAPDLSFLSNVDELTTAISELHTSWEKRRRHLEAALAESRILIDSLPDIILLLNYEHRVTRTNSRVKRMFAGKFFQETLDSITEDPEIRHTAALVMKDHMGRDVYFYLDEPYDRHFLVRIERFPVLTSGEIALIVVMHDITELKHTEKMLSDFVANASHEIRTPLASIAGLIETLQTTARDDPQALEQFLAVMDTQARRMTKLVNGLLSLSQIERNIHTPPTGLVHVPTVLRNIQAQMSLYADEKDMTINLEADNTIPVITGEVDEISLMFENIVSNAIKYGYDGTDVRISARLEENSLPDEPMLRDVEKFVRVEVRDRGIGIAREYIPRLTERFFRIDQARSRKVRGTGLGLSITKYVLERHHGLLKVESVPHEGSVFTVYLPVTEI